TSASRKRPTGACGAFQSSAWTTSSGLPTIPTPIAAGRTPGHLWTRTWACWERRSSARSPATTRCDCTVSRDRGLAHASADQPSAPIFHIPPNYVVERVRHSSKAARGEDLQVEHPICGGDASAFHFHPTLTRVLGSTLIRNQVVQVGQPRQKRL